MCGINGIINVGYYEDSEILSTLHKMNHQIIHRGPDDDGFFLESNDDYKVAMAMRRLSIIDLTTGKQPIYSKDRQKVIVFNGEIFNYLKLKEMLILEGSEFTTSSDTEVILKLYEKYGTAAFAMLDGMFAISIFDKTINKVFLARDFFGEKPLYYTQNKDAFYWASELKSIIKILPRKPAISTVAMNLFFQLTYIPAPNTIYDGIFKLEANHYLEYDCFTSIFEIIKIEQDLKGSKMSNFSEVKQKAHDLVRESVISRMVSDVRIGTFLSGGVDSSIVSLCVAQESNKKIDTFSIGFEKKAFDESEKARIVAKLINSNHHEFIIGEADLTNNIGEILLNFDEPFADSSALASFVVANKTSSFVKVALTGDGGDEVFGGYNKYYMGNLNRRYTNLISEKIHKPISHFISPFLNTKEDDRGWKFKLKRLMNAINYDDNFYYKIISLGFPKKDCSNLLKNNLFIDNVLDHYKEKVNYKSKTITDFRNLDRILSLEGDMLVKVDRTSMLTSLECRAPFLNKKLWNFTDNLPESYLIKGWDKKYVLKKAFEHYFPKDFLNKSKKGFGVPVGDWLRVGLKNELLSFIEKSFIEKQNLFSQKYVEFLIINHIEGKLDNTFKVWTYYCFQLWYKNTYERL